MAGLPPNALRDEHGFTLAELLVVILIIGLLAAIVVPQLLKQPEKADDAATKGAVVTLSLQVDSCDVQARDFTLCDSESAIQADSGSTGASWGTGLGQVEVSQAATDTYEIVGHSASGTRFVLTRDSNAEKVRNCIPRGFAGCPPDGNW